MKRKLNNGTLPAALLTVIIALITSQWAMANQRMDRFEAAQSRRMETIETAITNIRDRYDLITINSAQISALEHKADRLEAKIDKLLK